MTVCHLNIANKDVIVNNGVKLISMTMDKETIISELVSLNVFDIINLEVNACILKYLVSSDQINEAVNASLNRLFNVYTNVDYSVSNRLNYMYPEQYVCAFQTWG